MADKRALEWIKSTEEERKQLHTVVMAIRMAHNLSLDDVFEHSYGHPVALSEHDEKNFSRGIVGHKKVAPIHRWIIEHYLPIAVQIAPEIFDPSLLTRWGDFIGNRHLYGQLRTKLGGAMGLTARAIDQPIDDQRIRLGQMFPISS